ncbi:serine hydrolase [Hymenobacter swuensis]|uniref:serine hydrolase n=1 Tax=Hymenobacter swuensis TaxID=1446467 RepID=UPI0006935AE2|nr:serine hydrolase [Hymenobacter swuensis]
MGRRHHLLYAPGRRVLKIPDKFLQLVGGPAKLMAYIRQLGITPFVVEVSEAEMAAAWANQYRNWSYPSAQLDLLSQVGRRTALSKASSKLLWQLLLDTSVGPQRLKGLLPAGTPVAHRTGTSATNAQGLSPALNDVGIIVLPNGQHVALAVFVTDSYADTAAREFVMKLKVVTLELVGEVSMCCGCLVWAKAGIAASKARANFFCGLPHAALPGCRWIVMLQISAPAPPAGRDLAHYFRVRYITPGQRPAR